ncbi:hypothetical protein MPLB_1490018 [Mesorhizobium sp. ORS 3324]|nr:hypothetical protein MPLB_1490018 [Mesorhizobium sp. ORS 3324]
MRRLNHISLYFQLKNATQPELDAMFPEGFASLSPITDNSAVQEILSLRRPQLLAR